MFSSPNPQEAVTNLSQMQQENGGRSMPAVVIVLDIKTTINTLNLKKTPGNDLITGKMLEELPQKGFNLIAYFANALMRLEHFPDD